MRSPLGITPSSDRRNRSSSSSRSDLLVDVVVLVVGRGVAMIAIDSFDRV